MVPRRRGTKKHRIPETPTPARRQHWHRSGQLARRELCGRELILKTYKAEQFEQTDAFFHGKTGGRLVVVGPINLPVGRLFVEEVITECRKRGATRVDVLAFEFEMGLFPAVLDEAKQKGHRPRAERPSRPRSSTNAPSTRARSASHDVAYIEATPRYDKKDKLTVAIELTDFSVYYTQGLLDAIAAELKEGKSEVVCDAGQAHQGQQGQGQASSPREVLTKHWTDWVDYWAVDFDYESRKEIIKVRQALWAVEGELPGVAAAARRVHRIRGTLDRRLHLRKRMAELPHPPETATSNSPAPPTPTQTRAATPSPSKSSTSSATTR